MKDVPRWIPVKLVTSNKDTIMDFIFDVISINEIPVGRISDPRISLSAMKEFPHDRTLDIAICYFREVMTDPVYCGHL